MMKKTKFDFVLPIGETCVTAYNVRRCGLQKESLPFDWIWISGLPMLTGFFQNQFSDFLRKENLCFLRNNGDADIYRDTLTKTEFWHDFMVGEDFDKAYESNYQKYQRRIKRMYYHLSCAQNILLIRTVKIKPHRQITDDDFMFSNAPENTQQLLQEFSEFQSLYPNKHIELQLFYLYDEPCEYKEYNLSPSVHICELFNDDKFGWKGDESAIGKVLAAYQLSWRAKLRYGLNTVCFKLKKLGLRMLALLGHEKSRCRLKKKS